MDNGLYAFTMLLLLIFDQRIEETIHIFKTFYFYMRLEVAVGYIGGLLKGDEGLFFISEVGDWE